jgi:integrase
MCEKTTGDMPRPRPPYLQRHTTRHGKTAWYVRIIDEAGGRKNIRVRGEYGTPQFFGAYNAIINGAPAAPPRPYDKASPGTVKWLIDRYRDSRDWQAYSSATRRQREFIFLQIIAKSGNEPLRNVTRGVIAKGRDDRAKTPNQARHFMEAVRGLFSWALDAQLVAFDPTAGLKDPPRKKGSGFRVWTEEEVQRYEARWPVGTRERVWLDVLLYSGLRRSDAVRLGRGHVRSFNLKGKRIRVHAISTQKSGETVEVTLPILPQLQATLDAGPIGEATYVAGVRGKPFTKESFGTAFAGACKLAGVPGRAHGLRKLGASRAAENGATVNQLQALFGWTDVKMPMLYTKSADRKRLGVEAGSLLTREGGAREAMEPATATVLPLKSNP